MKTPFTIIAILLILTSCGEQFDSQKPWEHPVVDGSLKQESVSEAALNSIINPFLKEEATSKYYFEETTLLSDEISLSLYRGEDKSRPFVLNDQRKAVTKKGVWTLKVNKFSKDAFIQLDFNSGDKKKITVDKKDSSIFLYDNLLLSKNKIESEEMSAIPNRFCKMNVSSAGRELRKLIDASLNPNPEISIDFEGCILTYKNYIDESRDPMLTDNEPCKNLNRKYKTLTKNCKI